MNRRLRTCVHLVVLAMVAALLGLTGLSSAQAETSGPPEAGKVDAKASALDTTPVELSGTVTLPGGAPVTTDTQVGVLLHRWDPAMQAFSWVSSTDADAGGDYTFTVEPGSYTLSAYDWEGIYQPGHPNGATSLPVGLDDPGVVQVAADTPLTVPLQLRNDPWATLGQVRGMVTDSAGAPLEDLYVEFFDTSGSRFDVTYTDVTGLFTANVPAGDVEVRVHAGERYLNATRTVTVNEDQTTDLGTIQLANAPQGTLSGRVLQPDGQPSSYSYVELYRISESSGVRTSQWVDDADANDDGTYTFSGVRLNDRDYSVRAYGTGLETWLGNTVDLADAQTVSPTQTETTVPDIQLLPGGSVTGTVSGPSGPAEDIGVEAMRWSDADTGWDPVRTDYTAADGTYSLTGLRPGTYTLYFDSSAHGTLDSAWLEGTQEPASDTAPGTFTVGLDAPVTKNRTLPVAPRATGRVLGVDGAGLAEATVTTYVWDDGYWNYWGSPAATAADGSYSLQVPTGRTVTLAFTRGGYQRKFLGGGASLPSAPEADNSIQVGEGSSNAIPDITLDPRVSKVGKVAGQRLDYCLAHTLAANDDSSSDAVPLPFDLKFFGTPYDEIFVNNNGNVTFGSALSQYTPSDLTGSTDRPIIAPFFADVDTRGDSNQVTYGASPDGKTFCVNWADVGYYGSETSKTNTFQLLLTSNETSAGRVAGDFDMTFNYDEIVWESGTASDGDSQGLGGTSAAVGFSAGEGVPGTFVQLPGSLVNGALLDGGSDALIAGSQGSAQAGRYVFQVRNDGLTTSYGGLQGSVVDDEGSPVAAAQVEACHTSGSGCQYTTTDADGAYRFTALRAGNYAIRVWPPDSSLFGGGTTAQVASGQTTSAPPIVLAAPEAMPDGVSLNGESGNVVPSVYYNDPLELVIDGCAAISSPRVTVTLADGTVVHSDVAMTEVTPGHYTATIPPLYPHTGEATLTTNVPTTCGGDPVRFDLYIDPSGIVADQYGRPLSGATVTLLRSDTADGEFTVVPDGSDIMSPSNRSNPSITDSTGYFRWDVQVGFYKVKAEQAGCAAVTTPAMEVPPERIDLLIKLTCDAAAPTATTAPSVSGTPAVGETLTAIDAVWPDPLRSGAELLRNGEPLGRTTHTLTAADAGATFTTRSTARRPDYVQENGTGERVQFEAVSMTSTPVTVAKGAAAVATTAPELTGTARVGETLTVTDGTWSRAGITLSRQWLRNGQAISGATGTSYTLAAEDLGASVSVRFTATQTGYEDGSAMAGAKTVAKGAQAANTALPAITGTPTVGQTLTAAPGTWDRNGLTFTYQWTRSGAPIAGATAATYAVDAEDVNQALAVTVTASKVGHDSGSATSSPVTVGKFASKAVVKLARKKIKRGSRPTVTVKVTAPGAQPTGKVTVYVGKKAIAAKTLKASHKGMIKVKLKKISKKGTYKIKVKYAGDTLVSGATSKVVQLKVA